MTILWRLIIGGLWKPIAWVLGVGATYIKGRADMRAKTEAEKARGELEAHERINNADTGIGATDADRIIRLREFASRNKP